MAFSSAKNLIATVAKRRPRSLTTGARRGARRRTGGSTEPLLTFVARERGVAEDVFLQKLAAAIGWPFLDLHKHTVPQRGAQQNFHQGRVPIFRPAGGGQRRHAASRRQRPVRRGDDERRAVRRAHAGGVRARAENRNRKGAEKILRRRRRNARRTGRGRGDGPGHRRQGNHRGRPGGQRHQIRQPDHLGGAQGPRDGHPFRAGGGRVAHPLPH